MPDKPVREMITITARDAYDREHLNVTVSPSQLWISKEFETVIELVLEADTSVKIEFEVELAEQRQPIDSSRIKEFSIPRGRQRGTYSYKLSGTKKSDKGEKLFSIPNCPEIIIQ